MRTVSSVRSDGEKLQIAKLAHDEREKRLLEKKRLTRYAQNTENNTQNRTKMTEKTLKKMIGDTERYKK